jgi:hypothetical protein
MYAEYDFYLSDYKGSVIPDAPSYDRVAVEASAFLDYVTHNHIKDLTDEMMVKVKLAQCAIADVCYKQEKDDVANVVSSESVGNHSVTYAVSKVGYKQRELEKYSKAKIYLHGTGLLYGGLR